MWQQGSGTEWKDMTMKAKVWSLPFLDETDEDGQMREFNKDYTSLV